MKQKELMMKRLIPLEIVELLAYEHSSSRTIILSAISYPNFPVWLLKARAKVREIKADVEEGLRFRDKIESTQLLGIKLLVLLLAGAKHIYREACPS